MHLGGINRTVRRLLPSIFLTPHVEAPRGCRSTLNLHPAGSSVRAGWSSAIPPRHSTGAGTQFVTRNPLVRASRPTVVSIIRFFPCTWTAAPAPQQLAWNLCSADPSTESAPALTERPEIARAYRHVHRRSMHGETPERDTRSWWLALLLGFLFLLRVVSL